MRRKYYSLTWLIIATTLCCPALKCFATTEPELTTAIRHKDIQRIQTLLSEGVNVNERDEGAEQTPLMWAVKVGDFNTVRSLLDHHASVNLKDGMGRTALAIAQQRGYFRIERLLIENGAKLPARLRTPSGRLASVR